MTEDARLEIDIITPSGQLPSESAEYVVLPAADGYIGILPRHISLVTVLKAGVITFRRPGGKRRRIAVSGGFAEVAEDRIAVLADTAELPGEIDVERARKALQRAERRLQEKPDGLDVVRARASLERAIARLRVAGEMHVESEVS
ncbi:MAG: F0F1 ATP synthase subunit epsilon [Bacillota bacterium]|jgi:F-type H+-transporting ATPase subunit epsilon